MAVIKKFISLGSVQKGDLLLTYDGTEEIVESIEFIPSTEDVYNLEVSGNHNYYAEGILVHNKCVDWGKWEGSDKETGEEVKRDKAAWEATKTAMEGWGKKAETLQEQYTEGIGMHEDIYQAGLEADTTGYQEGVKAQLRDYTTQQESAKFQAGKTGLVSGTATENIAKGGESFRADIAGGQDVFKATRIAGAERFEGEAKGRETGLENTLYDIHQKQQDLYSGYVRNMVSGGDIPTFEGSYTGGTEWQAPQIGETSEQMGLYSKCFSADTRVDDKEISKIEVGDMVSSYNEETETIEKAEVVETFRHKNDNGYLIVNGRIKATPNHPFYIRRNI